MIRQAFLLGKKQNLNLGRRFCQLVKFEEPSRTENRVEQIQEVCKPSQTKNKKIQQGVGASLVGSGALWLSYQYLLPLVTYDNVAIASIVAGVGVLAGAQQSGKRKKVEPKKDKKQKFDLELLNDSSRFGKDIKYFDAKFGLDLSKLDLGQTLNPIVKTLTKKSKDAKKAQDEELRSSLSNIVKEDSLSIEDICHELVPRVFVLDFAPGMQSDGSNPFKKPEGLRKTIDLFSESISFLLNVVGPKDEVVLRLTSPGGPVAEYGLAAAQLMRFRKKSIPLTVCIDVVGASGGFLMACAASKVVASPFAYIGSIGVVAMVPNFNEKLKKNDIEWNEFTSGKYKRTVTIFGENTEEKKEKFQKDMDTIFNIFRNVVAENRPNVNIDEVATGEVWLGSEALKKGLVDDLMTSEELIRSYFPTRQVFLVKKAKKKKDWKEIFENMSISNPFQPSQFGSLNEQGTVIPEFK